jgi:hypothetical protein
MNNSQHNYNKRVNLSVTDEINAGYISYHTLLVFIDADQSSNELEMKWLELNLIAIERYIKQGQKFAIQSELNTVMLRTKNEFYQWCKLILDRAYYSFLRTRHS